MKTLLMASFRLDRHGRVAGSLVLAVAALGIWWHAESAAATATTQVDVSTAPPCGPLRDLHMVVAEGVRARGWLGLTPLALSGADTPVRFLAFDMRLDHSAGGETLLRGLTSLAAGSSEPAISTHLTLSNFGAPGSSANMWFAVRVAPAAGLVWGDVAALDQVDVSIVPVEAQAH